MVARIWTGAVRKADGDTYAQYMRETGVAAYAETPGNRGVWMLRRNVDDRTEFAMFTPWDSLDAVEAFAGEEYETAVFYPEDERFLVERDLRAPHLDIDAYKGSPDDRPARLRGEQVVLRPLRVDDLAQVVAIQAERGVARWWGRPDETELRRQAEGQDDARAFAIEREGELVGLIQFHEENEPDFRHAGRGLGTNAVRTLARYLIEERLRVSVRADHRQPASSATPAAPKSPRRRAPKKSIITVSRFCWPTLAIASPP